jgi:hypothetical protein
LGFAAPSVRARAPPVWKISVMPVAGTRGKHDFDIRANRVVLIRWQRDGRQNADDRNDDHQFDQVKSCWMRFIEAPC